MGSRDTSTAKSFRVASLRSLSRLRNDLRAFLSGAGVAADQLENAILVAHELTANAIEHGARGRDAIAVDVAIEGDDLLISVRSDPVAAGAVAARAPAPSDERGRGLMIVGAVADWWETRTAHEHVVTARVPG